MTKAIRIVCGDEIFAHWPSGRVQFLTLWQFVKLAWWALRNKVEIQIEEADQS